MTTTSRTDYETSPNASEFAPSYESPQHRHAIHIDPAMDTIQSVHDDTLVKDSICEMVGTALFVYISLSGVHQAVVPIIGTTNAVDQFHVAICFALGLTAGIYAAQKSGGHLNPAVSFTFWASGEIPFIRMISYIVSQMIGGFIGALLVLIVNASRLIELRDKHESSLIGMFGTLKDPNNSLFAAIVDQFIGSALLMVAIITIPGSAYKPVLVGSALGALGLFQGTNGFAFNAARDLSPRIASTILYGALPFTSCSEWLWIPVVVPFVGVPTGLILVYAFVV
jgi:glycerol uptake facilitator protein